MANPIKPQFQNSQLNKPFVFNLANKIDAIVQIVVKTTGIVAFIGLFITIGVGITMRYLTSHGAGWINELPYLIFPWLCASSFILAAQAGAHIIVNFFSNITPEKYKLWIAGFVEVFSIGIFLWLTYSSINLVIITSSENYPILGIPTAWAYVATTFACALLALTAITNLLMLISMSQDPLTMRKQDWQDLEVNP